MSHGSTATCTSRRHLWYILVSGRRACSGAVWRSMTRTPPACGCPTDWFQTFFHPSPLSRLQVMLNTSPARFLLFLWQRSLAVTLVVLLSCSASSRADDWPQFRGPNCIGISTGTKPLPVEFSATDNLRWSAKIGDGVGGAVIAAGRVFVSGMTADETVSLFAFDTATGEKRWQRDWKTGPLAEIHLTNSHASATPAA